MRRFGRALGRILMVLALAVVVALALGPREPAVLPAPYDAATLPADLDAYLASREAVMGDIVPGTEKRIYWATEPGRKAPYALVYLHGFSGSSEEIRPVPDMVARGLRANLYFTRLAGHGRGGAALAQATTADWMTDLAEAVAIGERLGEKVYLVATSTGGTLAALAANDPALAPRIDGIVFVSPNFGLASPAGRLLEWPLARYWLPLVIGAERVFETRNEDHARFWTNRYPTSALIPMAALVRAARQADYTGTAVAALFLYSEEDQLISAAAVRDVAGQWGGPVLIEAVRTGPGDDPYAHVLAGDILSPGQTSALAARIETWIRAH